MAREDLNEYIRKKVCSCDICKEPMYEGDEAFFDSDYFNGAVCEGCYDDFQYKLKKQARRYLQRSE